jgi:putative CocE/NonD family hydrolase
LASFLLTSVPMTFDDGQGPAAQDIWIGLQDGTCLAGKLWLPPACAGSRFPAVLEWIPYRQSDYTAVADSMLHGWFAQHGLACLRVDLRGSGNSDGVLTDEYSAQEQDDAVEVIAWIAAQPWCTGAVGMIGISWGGFAALQVAARRPPALKAVITCCSTDDRYRTDVHRMGGVLLSDGLQWGTGLFTQLARPPDPAKVGKRWREMWLQRLHALRPPLAIWLAHPERDFYWRHGSVCEDYDAIECPVFAVGGWTDGYPDAVLRLMQHLSVPRRALIGPWTHVYPNWGQPGPRVGFLQECLRWWRRHLMGEDNGLDQEPRLRLWLGRDLVPGAAGLSIGGGWITVPDWPVAAPSCLLRPGEGLLPLPGAPQPDQAIPLDTPPQCGSAGGEWCPLDGGGNAPEFQADQQADDLLCLCYETASLTEVVTLVGVGEVCIDLALQGPAALLAIRLCEVREDGVSARITFGLLRVVRPPGVGPGQFFPVCCDLKSVAYVFGRGRKMRLALSSAYWPMAWPEPVPPVLSIRPSNVRLRLPGLPAAATEDAAPFGPPKQAQPLPHEVVEAASDTRRLHHDAETGSVILEVAGKRQTTLLGELVFGGSSAETYRIGAAGGQASFGRVSFMQRPGWDVRVETTVRIDLAANGLSMHSSLTAFESGAAIFQRTWESCFPPAGADAPASKS